jgi:hypothetical protein
VAAFTSHNLPSGAVMSSPAYLRRQAAHCLSLARACFDLGTAQQLRLLADDLTDKAQELENADFPRHLMVNSGRPTGNVDRD